MIDALHIVVSVKRIPLTGLVGMDRRAERNNRADCRNCFAFLAENESPRATLAFANNHNDLPLAGLFFR